ncbi:MAG: HAD-IC family P-type ATPase [Gammaproteobacteria bacterium]|nr:HAD-IC family P-type ATPase [Gammaproteobacteria bacterium]
MDIRRPHALPVAEVLRQFGSRCDGLRRDEAARCLAEVGPNRLPEPPRDPAFRRFLRQFHNLLIYILLAAALLTALLAHWVDTGVIVAIVLINAAIGFVQEGKAEQALASIRRMLELRAQVRRDGEWSELKAAELVPGDVVRLRSGDRVPADLRLFEAVQLEVEESALTGESEPARKDTEPTGADSGVGDRHGMVHAGTLVVSGRGVGVVTSTGVATELGRISRLAAEVRDLETPLTRQMNRFSRLLALAVVAASVLLFGLGALLHEYRLPELLFAAIGFAVAVIPEGLPAILTITLALGVQRMARHRAITRRLHAVETLGSVTVICADKTGTLTCNAMTARRLVTAAGRYEVSGSGFAPAGQVTSGGAPAPLDQHPDLQALIETLAVANDAEIRGADGEWLVTGQPTEGALRALAGKAGFDDAGYTRVAALPFESGTRCMATLNRRPGGGARILVKGAPDRLLAFCRRQYSAGGGSAALDRDFWELLLRELGGQGLRVLAAAARDVDPDQWWLAPQDLTHGLVFLGLVGIHDPPRPEAAAAIRACRTAGIRVKMITGDHLDTARAIAHELGIDDRQAVTGAELESAAESELRRIARDCDVFARTSPEHKLRLMQALQASGEIVAMTGDGINDAPALRRADVGIAMGVRGTEATREAADLVLADDNFATIARAVAEGRTICDNLRKAIVFILPTNGAEGLVMLAAVAFGLVLPLTPVQILWVNTVTAVTLDLALAFEPAEPDVMRRPPRPPAAPILDAVLLWRIALVSLLVGGATLGLFLLGRRLGLTLPEARTLAVNTLVAGELFYLFNIRALSESVLQPAVLLRNPLAWLAVSALVVLQLLFVYAPCMQRWFGTAPLAPATWLLPAGVGLVVLLVVEGEKALRRRRALR